MAELENRTLAAGSIGHVFLDSGPDRQY
jgi:hypothetical protein